MQKPKQVLADMLEKKVDRREFLRLGLVAALALIGFSRLVDSVDQDIVHGGGYGSGVYGGGNDSRSTGVSNGQQSKLP